MEEGFDSDIGGDVPDWDNTESRESDEDAAWRDLVARFEEPTTTTGPTPWPERENVPGPRAPAGPETDGTYGPQGAESSLGGSGAEEAPGPTVADGPRGPDGARGTDGLTGTDGEQGAGGTGKHGGGSPGARGTDHTRGTRGVEGIRGFDDEGVRRAFGAEGRPETSEPDVIQAARRDRRATAHGTRARKIRARRPVPPRPAPQDDGEHFIPPAPPPLPSLDPLAKGAWAALFGGPGYLVIATAAGWSVSGVAAFCAVAAFVAGFAILVLRMNEPGPGGPDDDGDDGAVV